MESTVEVAAAAATADKRRKQLIKQWHEAVEETRLKFKGLQQALESMGVMCEAMQFFVHPDGDCIAHLSEYVQANEYVKKAVSGCISTVLCVKQASLSAKEVHKARLFFNNININVLKFKTLTMKKFSASQAKDAAAADLAGQATGEGSKRKRRRNSGASQEQDQTVASAVQKEAAKKQLDAAHGKAADIYMKIFAEPARIIQKNWCKQNKVQSECPSPLTAREIGPKHLNCSIANVGRAARKASVRISATRCSRCLRTRCRRNKRRRSVTLRGSSL